MKPGDVVEALWDDHVLHQGHYGNEGTFRFRTIGYFAREDDGVLCLSMSLTPEGKPYDTLVIDKRTLVSRKKVR